MPEPNFRDVPLGPLVERVAAHLAGIGEAAAETSKSRDAVRGRLRVNVDPLFSRMVLSPKDIEDWTGLSEGNIFQGELSLEQLFFNRPVPGWARYRTPVKALWMCGSATHPGGGIMGAPGRIAALEYLKESRRRRSVA